MKKKTYVWLASILLMLVATLTSCEKFALDDSGTNSHDANANVIIHASVAKNNSTGTRSGEEDFEDEEDGDEDGSEEGDEESVARVTRSYQVESRTNHGNRNQAVKRYAVSHVSIMGVGR